MYGSTNSSVARTDNVISSDIIYKIKDDDDCQWKLKARLVLQENCGKGRYSVLRDSTSAYLSVVCLPISLSVILGFDIATAYVNRAYIQSSPIKRKVFVRPPKQIVGHNILWKLLW